MDGGAEGAISRWMEEVRELYHDGCRRIGSYIKMDVGAEGAILGWVEELRELYYDGWRM